MSARFSSKGGWRPAAVAVTSASWPCGAARRAVWRGPSRIGHRPDVPLRLPVRPIMMEARRVIALEGGTNFRDLGGYATPGGGRMRWGLVFRSAALHRLTDRDLA